MHKSYAILKKTYRALKKEKKPIRSGSSAEWILDNYYILSGEFLALRGLRRTIRKKRPAWKHIFTFTSTFLSENEFRLDEAALSEALSKKQDVSPLGAEELRLLPAALSAALFIRAGKIAKNPYEDSGMGNIIKSFLVLRDLDIKKIFANHSKIDVALSEDVAFSASTFATKELYRRAATRLATEGKTTDAHVARTALWLCRSKKGTRTHVGHFLLGEGENTLRAALSLPPKKTSHAFAFFLSAVCIITFLLFLLVLTFSGQVALSLLALFPAFDCSVQLLRHILLKNTPVRTLPRLSLKEGIPEKVLIVFPTLLSSVKKAEEMVEKLEVCYLANRDPNLAFAVLGDFKDSTAPAENPEIPAAASAAISRLNEKYGPRFFLLCRGQVFAPRQGKWMGEERKRGALSDLNAFLRGKYIFRYTAGPVDSLIGIRYVLTLDDDTLLPPGAAKKLIGTALHPQNAPRIEGGRVVSGYGIIQPRIGLRLESANRTLFSRIFAGASGTDTYRAPTAEFYMDVFGESIFTGKGIYHVDAFMSCISFPQDTVLSHDILEGGYLRCGLASDVQVFDSFPHRYADFCMRQNRWTRGDWQNLPWLLKTVRNKKGEKVTNVLSPLSKWKIFDNLRRSITPAAILLALSFGTMPFVLLAFAALLIPLVLCILESALQKSFLHLSEKHLSDILGSVRLSLYEVSVSIVFLPHTAFLALSAACTGIIRLWKRKSTLEWVTASDAENGRHHSLSSSFSQMLFSVIFGLFLLLAFLSGVFPMGGMQLLLAIAFLISPALAYFIGRESFTTRAALPEKDKTFLLDTAERIWQFFRDYMTEEENFLPPDNIQVSPYKGIAHRTSPTNIGLSMLAALAACDLGFINREEMETRISKTMDTVEKLSTFKGHLYNWYDTRTLKPLSPRYISTVDSGNFACYLLAVSMGLSEYAGEETALSRRLLAFAEKMDFRPFYNEKKKLFSIGFSIEENRLTDSYYDLLMSEARQAGYFAIAMGQIPPEHWFSLGRGMVEADHYRGLVSWSGTMFEYFMPLLLMKNYENSLLSETYRFALHCQKRVGRRRRVPWGVSESGFYAFDKEGNYQYKAFGVPELRLSRQDNEDVVITPYAAALALPLDPKGAVANLRAMRKDGLFGAYGFFEAADYTRSHLSGNMRRGIVKSYMAHHQGMTLAAITNVLLEDSLQRRFHAHPAIRAAEPLLKERVPMHASVLKEGYERISPVRFKWQTSAKSVRECTREETYPKSVHLLSNGSYHVAIDTDGQGRSSLDSIEYNTFSPVTGGGQNIKIINAASGLILDGYGTKCLFSENCAEYTGEENSIFTKLTVSVLPEYNVETRRLTLMNKSEKTRVYEAYYYTPLSLATKEAERAHPAFSKLFVTTKKKGSTLFAERRKRSEDEKTFIGFATAICEGNMEGGMQFDTDRLSFYGRGARLPKMLASGSLLAGKTGTVLDPCFALKIRISIEPGMSGSVTFLAGLAETEGEAEKIIANYKNGVSSSTEKKESSIVFREGEEESFLHAASFLLFGGAKIPKIEEARLKNRLPREALWKLGISGDVPIVTLRLTETADAPLLEEAIKALTFWKQHGILADLVVFCDEPASYDRPVFQMAEKRKSGAMFILGRSDVDANDQTLLLAASTLFIDSGSGGFASLPSFTALPKEKVPQKDSEDGELTPMQLLFDNGYGGFSKEADEYVINMTEAGKTPLPWVHVVANPNFGFLASEGGSGYTWSGNSQSFRISPWSNDPVLDPVTERLSIAEKNDIWSPMAAAFPEKGNFRTRYGAGYVVYERHTRNLMHTATLFTPPEKAQKIISLSLENRSDETRELTLEYAFLPVLGTHINTDAITVLEKENCIRLRNTLEKNGNEVYLKTSGDAHYGQRGQYVFAKTTVRLKPQQEKSISFVLGVGAVEAVDTPAALTETKQYWDKLLHTVTVETGHAATNLLMNTWLLYQATACRLFARSAFYQSGGAFGFRDQLQDVLALMDTAPHLVKKQICLHAAHQFVEGDVFHWWHEDGRGVRTRFSDDRLFLPYVAAIYAEETGDAGIWDLTESFVVEPPLSEGEAERYTFIKERTEPHTIYEHAVRAIEGSLQKGPHALPLMGGGDWNDGMNTIGIGGRGESVWLGWFLKVVLEKFAPWADARGDHERAERYRREALLLAEAAELEAWDGTHFARAFFDDGTPCGTAASTECSIDAISQAWAVMAGGIRHDRLKTAMQSVYNSLVDKEVGIIKLLAPPFEKSNPSPGYIQSYPRGLRENGGQYTHGAIWVVIAFALLGEQEKAWELFKMVNPILHAETPSEVHTYKTEPYVMSADIYTAEGHAGRGGWSWYTGAAAWMYRLGIRYMVGFQRSGDTVSFSPSMPIPKDGICVRYRFGNTQYIFHVHGKSETIKLTDDGGVHELSVG